MSELKTDVRKISRGNIPKFVSNAKRQNAYYELDLNQIHRAEQIALQMAERTRQDFADGNLCPQGLANRNNKIRLINSHLPAGSEVQTVLGNFKHGGTVPKTGLYKLHKGEKVIPVKK